MCRSEFRPMTCGIVGWDRAAAPSRPLRQATRLALRRMGYTDAQTARLGTVCECLGPSS